MTACHAAKTPTVARAPPIYFFAREIGTKPRRNCVAGRDPIICLHCHDSDPALAMHYTQRVDLPALDSREDGHVLPTKVDTTRQLADICTKALPHVTFVALRGMLMGRRFDADPIIHIDTLTQNLRAAPSAA